MVSTDECPAVPYQLLEGNSLLKGASGFRDWEAKLSIWQRIFLICEIPTDSLKLRLPSFRSVRLHKVLGFLSPPFHGPFLVLDLDVLHVHAWDHLHTSLSETTCCHD